MNYLIKLAAVIVFALGSNTASAILITHGSDGAFTSSACTGGAGTSATFDCATYLFTPTFADTITVSNFGSGIAHDHNFTNARTQIDILNGIVWSNVFSHDPVGYQTLASIFASPVTFSGQVISGLRLASNVSVNQMFHNVNFNMQYATSGTAVVPEPAGIALLGIGLLTLIVVRRKRSSSNSYIDGSTGSSVI